MRKATMAMCPAPLNLIVLRVIATAESSQGTKVLGRCNVVKYKDFVRDWIKKCFGLEANRRITKPI